MANKIKNKARYRADIQYARGLLRLVDKAVREDNPEYLAELVDELQAIACCFMPDYYELNNN